MTPDDTAERLLDHGDHLIRIVAPGAGRPHQSERRLRRDRPRPAPRCTPPARDRSPPGGPARAPRAPRSSSSAERAAGGRRLGDRPRQRRRSLGQRSRRQRAPASLGKQAGDDLVPTGLRMQQVRRDRLRRGSRLTEDARRLRVQPGTLARGQPAQHRVAHQPVLELERAKVSQDPGTHQLLAERRRPASEPTPASRAAVTSGALSSTATACASRTGPSPRRASAAPTAPATAYGPRRVTASASASPAPAMPRSRSPSASRWINSGLPPVAP